MKQIAFDRNTIFLLTGAYGHLGNVLVRQLLDKGARVRALIHPRDLSDERYQFPIELVRGDLKSRESLKAAFSHKPNEEIVVIHMASIVSTMLGVFKKLYKTNVVGTKNLLDLSVEAGARRFLYVSSVHALTELPHGQVQSERTDFDAKCVIGSYAKSKAMASRYVYSYRNRLDIVIVHPSGIIGPGDYIHSPTNQVFFDFLSGKLPAIIKGGYDFVDVRDVANGIVNAITKGISGENYLLTGNYLTVAHMIGIMAAFAKKKVPKTLPLWVAKMVSPFVEAHAKLWRKRPLFTPYSLYTTSANGLFCHDKADRELGYSTRPIEETIADLYRWYYDVIMKPKRRKGLERKRYQ